MSTEPTPSSTDPATESVTAVRGRSIGRCWAMVGGLAAVGAFFGVAELLAALSFLADIAKSATSSSPLWGLGSTFISFTPEWLKHLAIQWFGVHDKDALRIGMYLTLVVAAALIGLLARRSVRAAMIVAGVLGVVVFVAVITRPGAGLVDGLPTVIGLVVGLFLLHRLFRRPSYPVAPQARRTFLLTSGAGIGGAALSIGLAKLLPTSAKANASAATAADGLKTAAVDKMTPLPAKARLDTPGLSSFVTPNNKFYRIDTAFEVPRIDAGSWQLRIHGMVENEIVLDYATLLARPLLERMVTLTCVSNEVGGDLVGNAVWQGTLIRDVLNEARPLADADMVLSGSDDGFSASTPLSVLMDKDRDSIFAVTMNGDVLPFEHGFPVRMVVPGLYGYVSATKWVTDIEVTRFDRRTSYWTDRGWSPMGPIKTSSRVDVPTSFQQVPAGRFAIAGMAWAQHRGISEVQVQIDDGPWNRANLSTEVTTDIWRQWSYVWEGEPGLHTVTCRAVDNTGAVQDATSRPPIPGGSTGYDKTSFTVV